MSTKLIKARNLKMGDTLLLPFGKTATIQTVKVGRSFVNLRTEHGPTRIELDKEVAINV